MVEGVRFERGDVVFHAKRPEWGEGVVEQAREIKHEGRAAQRLTIRFSNHGRVAVNTAVAQLRAKRKGSEGLGVVMSNSSTPAVSSSAGKGWLSSLEKSGGGVEELWSLPEAMTDLFASLGARLQATLDSFRFSTEARSLIDWAVAQTGLTDPLSKYNRHELEQGFERFARDRDRHLVELVRTAKREGQADLLDRALQGKLIPEARRTLKKAIRN